MSNTQALLISFYTLTRGTSNPKFDGHRWCEVDNGVEVVEPDPNRLDTWFFLSGWKDNNLPGSNSAADAQSEEDAETAKGNSTALPNPATCNQTVAIGDWGARMLCDIAIAITNTTDTPYKTVVADQKLVAQGEFDRDASMLHNADMPDRTSSAGEGAVVVQHQADQDLSSSHFGSDGLQRRGHRCLERSASRGAFDASDVQEIEAGPQALLSIQCIPIDSSSFRWVKEALMLMTGFVLMPFFVGHYLDLSLRVFPRPSVSVFLYSRVQESYAHGWAATFYHSSQSVAVRSNDITSLGPFLTRRL